MIGAKRQSAPRRSVKALGDRARAVGLDSFWKQWGSSLPSSVGGDHRRRDRLDATWTYAAVTAIAEAIGRTPRRLVDSGDNLIEQGPLFDLICQPNEQQDDREFFEVLALLLLTRGAAAIVKDFGPGDGARSPLPRGLLAADASQLHPVWSAGRLGRRVSGWIFQPHGAPQVIFERDEIVVIRRPDPQGQQPMDGLSPQTGSRDAIELDLEMRRFARAFFQNDGAPGFVLTTDNPLTQQQIHGMVRMWEQRHGGASRAHRVAVLHKGLKPFQPGSMRDLTLVDLSRRNRDEQLAVYRVPPIVVAQVDDANRSNSDAQMASFLSGPVMSDADRIATAINRGVVAAHPWPDRAPADATRMAWSRERHHQTRSMRASVCAQAQRNRLEREAFDRMPERIRRRLAPAGGPIADLFFLFDFDSNATIARAKADQAQSMQAMHNLGVPLNALLDYFGLPLPRLDSGDVAFLPFSLAPADQIAQPSFSPGEIDDDLDDPPAASETDEDAQLTSQPEQVRSVREIVGAVRFAAMRGIAERHQRTFTPLARRLERDLSRHLSEQRDETLARVRDRIDPNQVEGLPAGGRSGDQGRAAGEIGEQQLLEVVFDLSEARERIRARTRDVRRATGRLGAAQGSAEAGLGAQAAAEQASILIDDPAVRMLLRQSEAAFTLIEKERHAQVQEVIRNAFTDPEKTFNDLVQDLKTFYGGEFTKARRAAMTETIKVLNGARNQGMKASGATGKLWLNTSDNVRATHIRAQVDFGSQPIPIDDPFIVGGAPLQFPGDPAGPAREIINCHCVQLAAFLGEEEGDGRALGQRCQSNGRGPGRFAALDAAIARYAELDFLSPQDVAEVADA